MGKCPYHAFTSLFRRNANAISTLSPQPDAHSGNVYAPASIESLEDEFMVQLDMIGLTVEDLNMLKKYQPIVVEFSDSIVESFYMKVLHVPGLQAIIMKNSSIERLRLTLRDHLIEMFDGRIDNDFVQKRLKIASVHQRIGLEPKWYMGAFQNLQNTMLGIIHNYLHDQAEGLALSKAITKLLNFEQQLVLEAYEKMNVEHQENQYELIKRQLKEKIISVSQRLALLTEQTNTSTQELIGSSNQVAASFMSSSEKTKESRSLALKGSENMAKLEQSMDAIHGSSMQMEGAVVQLRDSSLQIKQIVTIVEEISSQIKLLSLNASIEAARAGEYGAGFSVVAQEVKKLSEETRAAVSRISELIKKSNAYTAEVVHSIDAVQTHVQAGQQESVRMNEMFALILRSLESGLDELDLVEIEIQGLVSGIGEVGAATDEVASSAEELNHTANNY
ncbi:globin-coupled sensor protein [Paenibacillus spongiae]|uniref:Globin-coupled sensor protein n=1 Tax=Paenibacillus spongiae TaxID=2909671 RepID=A0ABY5S9Y4_9BACL|nr:globin-coupled sensor protein [Paenibacillus spongiae]UVI30746.1 globin-coupled sensor protein [Paenibacillus spongiae]